MRKVLWKKAALLSVLVLTVGLCLNGCRFGKTEVVFTSGLSNDEVFRIGGETCSLAAAKVLLANYQNIYGTAYGVELWNHDFGDNSLEQYIKDLTLSQLAQIVSMNFLAEEKEISLTKEELEQIRQAAEAYYESLSKAEIRYMDVDKGDITELYRWYGLANKLYAQLTIGIKDEVSDDEARVMEAYQILVSTKEKADTVAAELEKGKDFLSLAGTYNEASRTEISFGRGDMPAEVEKIAFYLDAGAVSEAIETEDGFYFIKCINNYDQELTDANKQVILERRKQEAFDDVYDAFIETLPSELNEELWDSVKIEVSEEIQTRSFFEVYEEYCRY